MRGKLEADEIRRESTGIFIWTRKYDNIWAGRREGKPCSDRDRDDVVLPERGGAVRVGGGQEGAVRHGLLPLARPRYDNGLGGGAVVGLASGLLSLPACLHLN